MLTPIKISQHPQLGPAVSGRQVYAIAAPSKSKRDIFSDWFRAQSRRLNLVEGKDYAITSVVLPGASRGSLEAIFTLPAAKQVAAIQASGRGAGIVAYINEYERTASAPQVEAHPYAGSNELPLLIPFSVETTTQPAPQPPPTPIQQLLQQAQELAAAEAKREREPKVAEESISLLEGRVALMESRLSIVLTLVQQATSALLGYEPVAPSPVKALTTREKLVRLVDGYAASKKWTTRRFGDYSTGGSIRTTTLMPGLIVRPTKARI